MSRKVINVVVGGSSNNPIQITIPKPENYISQSPQYMYMVNIDNDNQIADATNVRINLGDIQLNMAVIGRFGNYNVFGCTVGDNGFDANFYTLAQIDGQWVLISTASSL